jgi:hypothetical protein
LPGRCHFIFWPAFTFSNTTFDLLLRYLESMNYPATKRQQSFALPSFRDHRQWNKASFQAGYATLYEMRQTAKRPKHLAFEVLFEAIGLKSRFPQDIATLPVVSSRLLGATGGGEMSKKTAPPVWRGRMEQAAEGGAAREI